MSHLETRTIISKHTPVSTSATQKFQSQYLRIVIILVNRYQSLSRLCHIPGYGSGLCHFFKVPYTFLRLSKIITLFSSNRDVARLVGHADHI